MKKIAGLIALLALCACEPETETDEVQIPMPDDKPVVEQFELAMEIINALKADDFPKPFDRTNRTANPDDITSAHLTLSAVATLTEGPFVRDREQVFLVCKIHDREKAREIEQECRRRIAEQLESGQLERFAGDPFQEPIGHSLVLGDARQKLEERFGEPQETRTSQVDDRTGTARLSFYRLTYPGLVFVVGEDEDQTRSWIESIEISDGHPALKFGLGVGINVDAVATAFPSANSARAAGDLRLATTIYEDRDGVSVESHVELTFGLDAAGAVQSILIETIAL